MRADVVKPATLVVLLIGASLGSCGPVMPSPPTDGSSGDQAARQTVAGIEQSFDAIRRLHVQRYLTEPSEDCEVFHYARGYFVSAPHNEFCGWIRDGGPQLARSPFDERARQDRSAVLLELESAGVQVLDLEVSYASDGRIARGVFSTDRCHDYEYTPGWSVLPQANPGESVSPINADWLEVDYCR